MLPGEVGAGAFVGLVIEAALDGAVFAFGDRHHHRHLPVRLHGGVRLHLDCGKEIEGREVLAIALQHGGVIGFPRPPGRQAGQVGGLDRGEAPEGYRSERGLGTEVHGPDHRDLFVGEIGRDVPILDLGVRMAVMARKGFECGLGVHDGLGGKGTGQGESQGGGVRNGRPCGRSAVRRQQPQAGQHELRAGIDPVGQHRRRGRVVQGDGDRGGEAALGGEDLFEGFLVRVGPAQQQQDGIRRCLMKRFGRGYGFQERQRFGLHGAVIADHIGDARRGAAAFGPSRAQDAAGDQTDQGQAEGTKKNVGNARHAVAVGRGRGRKDDITIRRLPRAPTSQQQEDATMAP